MENAAKKLSDVPAINKFLGFCRMRTVPQKTVVIHAGDLPDILYYIVNGFCFNFLKSLNSKLIAFNVKSMDSNTRNILSELTSVIMQFSHFFS